MTIDKILKRALMYFSIGLGLTTTAQAEAPASKSALQFQGNLETAITSQKVIRTRALPVITFSRGRYSADYLGLHEVENLAIASYLGWQMVSGGKANAAIQPTIAAEITPETTDVKAGIRNSSLIERLKGYGFISGVTGITKANWQTGQIIWLYGRELGNTSLELLGFLDIPYGSKPSLYTEMQFNHQIAKHLAAFARAEAEDLNMKQAQYMVGLAVKK